MKVNEQNLESLGFKRYPSNSITFESSDFFYQKRFKDDRGIKYFVEFVHYEKFDFGNGNSSAESWMCALNINEPHMTFKQHRVEEIESALEKCEKFFSTMGAEYYELNQ